MNDAAETENPYQSPQAASDAPPVPVVRWRIVPTFLAALYAAGAIPSGVLELGFGLYLGCGGHRSNFAQDFSAVVPGWFLLDGSLSLLAGVLFCVAARLWWRSEYRRALLYSVAALLAYAISAFLKNNIFSNIK